MGENRPFLEKFTLILLDENFTHELVDFAKQELQL